jgi:hypothetical protein
MDSSVPHSGHILDTGNLANRATLNELKDRPGRLPGKRAEAAQ